MFVMTQTASLCAECTVRTPANLFHTVLTSTSWTQLVDEFGEETYQKCKRRVQDHMTSLSNEYNKMAGIPITSKSEILRCYANSKVVQMQESGKWWKNWAKFKIATLRGTAGSILVESTSCSVVSTMLILNTLCLLLRKLILWCFIYLNCTGMGLGTDGSSSSLRKVDLTGGEDEDVFAFETNQDIDDVRFWCHATRFWCIRSDRIYFAVVLMICTSEKTFFCLL